MLSTEEILEGLNEEQKIAVKNYSGPQFLIAGPGSGKTRTVISKTQYMLACGIQPENILLFTFTKKASREIKERIAKAVGYDLAKKLTIGTYHSFCFRLLREYIDKLGYEKNFSIFDTEDSKKIISKITEGTNITSKELLPYMSLSKRKMISTQKALENANFNKDHLATYYEKYQTELKKQNAIDFDDIIYLAVKLLKENLSVKIKINNQYKYIIADEFQDSSSIDIELMKLLSGVNKNITFVGDEDQSIYGFRGADIESVLSVDTIFKGLKKYYLNRNYRCSETIVEASKSLIKNNSGRLGKQLVANNLGGDKIIVMEEKNQNIEAIRVGKTINLLVTKYGYQYKDIAVLYRVNALTRNLEEVFLKQNIPYEILSGVNFFQRKEVKDIVAYLKFLTNKYDAESFTRAVNTPRRGIGEKTLEKIIEKAREDLVSIDLLTACKLCVKSGEIKGRSKKGLEVFISICDTIMEKFNDMSVADIIREIIKLTDYYTYLDTEEDTEERVSNIIELINLSIDCLTVEEFLEQASLFSQGEDKDLDNKVQLLTMHLSKGLEFKVVFIIGANEGICPSYRSLSSNKDIEEERRCFYVAATRAKERLFISRPKIVVQNGYSSQPKISRFVTEMDSKYIYKLTGGN